MKDKFYKPEIDGLRALAVISVVIFHFSAKLLPNGFLGVDVFFVISGFVVTLSLFQREPNNAKEFLLGFYSRRIKRLFPALLFCIVVTSLLGMLFMYPRDGQISGTSIRTCAYSFIGASNVYLFGKSHDYFSPNTELNPCTHTWSLGVEEQFYLIFPLIVLFFYYRGGSRKKFQTTIIVTSVLSLILFLWLSLTNEKAAFFLMPARFWELGLGSLSYLVLSLKERKTSDWLLTAAIISLVALMCLPQIQRPVLTIIIALITSYLLIFLNRDSRVTKFLSIKVLTYIGLLSYSIYLWHWPVLALSRWTVGINSESVILLTLLIAGFALFSYYFIEVKIRKQGWMKSNLSTILVGLAISILSLFLVKIVYNNAGKKLYLGHIQDNIEFKCQQGSKVKMALLGDSHSRAFLPVVSNASDRNCVSLDQELLIKLEDTGLDFKTGKTAKRLKIGDPNKLLERVSQSDLNQTQFLVIAYYWQGLFAPRKYSYKNSDWIVTEYISENESSKTFSGSLKEVSDNIKNISQSKAWRTKKIIVVLPFPDFEWVNNGGPPEGLCTVEWFRPNYKRLPDCLAFSTPDVKSREVIEQRRRHIIRSFKKLANSNQNIQLFDPVPYLCPNNRCSTHDGSGEAIFMDDDHINNRGAELLMKPFKDFLEKSP